MAGSTTTGDARNIKKPPVYNPQPTTPSVPAPKPQSIGYDIGRGVAFIKGMRKRKNQGLDFE